jgi:rhodanese-related sulfurtransferase
MVRTTKKMNRFTHIIFIVIAMLGFLDAAAQRRVKSGSYNTMLNTLLKHTVPEITVDSLARCKSKVVLLDAREPDEYKVSHLKDAVHVGYNNFAVDAVKHIPKTSPVVVYCSVGYRSEKVTEKLKAAGFTNVANLYGGIFEWKNQQHEVVDETGAVTEKVHAYSKLWGIWLKKGKKVYGAQ